MDSEILEKAHKTNISRLLEEFGDEKKEEILYLYENKRAESEQKARILDYVPIFVYRAVRETLTTKSR